MDYTVSLHTHLEGSIRPSTYRELMRKDLTSELTVSKNCHSLQEFLAKIERGCDLTQKRANLRRVAYECVETASWNNCLYLEIRFGPTVHVLGDMELPDTIEAVLEGLKAGEKEFGTVSRLIVATLRHEKPEVSKELARLAATYKDDGVVGFDIAGDEATYPAKIHQEAFEIAKKEGLGITVHAGEAGSAANVKEAILELGATRIGHGIQVVQDMEVMELAKEKEIVFEVCPTSNLHTGAILTLEKYPLVEMAKKGLKITINDDDPETSQISLQSEYELAEKLLKGSISRHELLTNAITGSFASEATKKGLLATLNSQ